MWEIALYQPVWKTVRFVSGPLPRTTAKKIISCWLCPTMILKRHNEEEEEGRITRKKSIQRWGVDVYVYALRLFIAHLSAPPITHPILFMHSISMMLGLRWRMCAGQWMTYVSSPSRVCRAHQTKFKVNIEREGWVGLLQWSKHHVLPILIAHIFHTNYAPAPH